MGAPIWESKGADFSNTSATPGFAIPAGTANGKIVIVSMFINVSTTLVTGVPAGFFEVAGSPVTGGSNKLVKYWKRLTGEDVGTYDFVLDSAQFIEGAAELYNDCVVSGNPFDLDPGTAFDNVNGTVTPEVSTSTNGPDRLIIHTATNWSGGTWTPPDTYTKRLQPPVGLVTTSDKSQPSEGSTGAVTAVATGNDKRTAHIVALIGTTTEELPSEPTEKRTGGWYDLIWISRYQQDSAS